MNTFKKDYFDDKVIGNIFDAVKKHHSQYNTLPPKDIIIQQVKDSEELLKQVDAMGVDVDKDKQYLYDKTNEYLKTQAFNAMLMKGVDISEKGKDKTQFLGMVEDALSQDLQPKKHNIIDMADLIHMDFPEIEIFVENVIPEGLTILAGKPKIGKSRLALNIMADVISGGEALGGFETKKSDVLFMGLEDPFKRMKANGKKIRPDYSKGLSIVCEWDPGQQGRYDLEIYLDANPNVQVVVIDTLSKVRRIGKSKNPYQEDYNEIDSWAQIAKSRGISIVMIHHLKKGMEEDPLDLLNGTSGLAAAADNVVILKQETQKNCNAFMYIRGNDIENNEYALSFDGDQWFFEGDADNYRGTQVQNQILQCFTEDEDITPKEIERRIEEMQYNYAVKIIKRMVDSGLLKKTGRGKYSKV